MKKIDIVSATPELLKSPFSGSIMKRALDKGLVDINFHDLKDYSISNNKQIDDYQFGGGAGMVLMIEPINNCVNFLKKQNEYSEIIYMTPDAPVLTQKICNKLSISGNLIIICGHYKGIDQRVRDNIITMEISIGDYVLSGGELPAAILCDSIVRLIPGVLNDGTSALTDSFQDNLLAPPVYTRPSTFHNLKVPDILISGNKNKIETWREEKSIEKTERIRPDLLKK
ncbi:MAG: tRNA (guanosine(37)-N1)-methyltransferase TrmD [Flavobacteriaceae bacterium]|nr:tRNA (guanosine(37)-N1)-methyltransferase TrmD [Flavobacteriaceae bacterium]|tara:strand:- start:5541 stop:6221 length:681 start_codon:yes stop_codon:yes gene_type:complete